MVSKMLREGPGREQPHLHGFTDGSNQELKESRSAPSSRSIAKKWVKLSVQVTTTPCRRQHLTCQQHHPENPKRPEAMKSPDRGREGGRDGMVARENGWKDSVQGPAPRRESTTACSTRMISSPSRGK